MSKESDRVRAQIMLIQEVGFPLGPDSSVLDLGCGNGASVKELRRLRYKAFGCDFVFKEGPDVESYHSQGLIRLIDRKPYRLPFADDAFDLVLSDQVFEHVKNYDETLSEIRRVLKPGGVSLHFFPSRYTPIEPHVYVPLATLIQKGWWLAIWATLGIRTPSQKGMSVRQVVDANHAYLTNNTNYLSKAKIGRFVAGHFPHYRFCEASFLKVSNRGRIIHQASRFLPVLPSIYSMLRARVLFLLKD
jgi:SAM-dependent methyltransferase